MAQSYPEQLAQAMREFLPPAFFSHIPVQAARWTAQRLAWIALIMAWDEGQTLATRFENACAAACKTHRHWTLGTSYSGFAEALVRATTQLAQTLKRRFQREMLRIAGPYRKRGRWLAFAADGTRLETPHTAANERELGCAGKDKTAPQVFLTTLWHMGTGLPWDYRVGPGTASERAHLKRMIPDLPDHALVVADAGFVGYGLCWRFLRHGRHFLLRVGGNITLLKDLGYYHEERDGLVYLWPQQHRRCQPLVLRLIVLNRGKQPVYLLTDVLDPEQLTDAEAALLYAMRWGEEVFYRSYKQTMQRRKLLSRTAATCLAEAQWTLLGLWLLGLMTVSRLIAEGNDPLAMSVAAARDAVRQALRDRRSRRGPRSLNGMLSAAIKDSYARHTSKAARNYPRKKREKPPKPPKIKSATEAEVKRARKLPPPEVPLRWTARRWHGHVRVGRPGPPNVPHAHEDMGMAPSKRPRTTPRSQRAEEVAAPGGRGTIPAPISNGPPALASLCCRLPSAHRPRPSAASRPGGVGPARPVSSQGRRGVERRAAGRPGTHRSFQLQGSDAMIESVNRRAFLSAGASPGWGLAAPGGGAGAGRRRPTARGVASGNGLKAVEKAMELIAPGPTRSTRPSPAWRSRRPTRTTTPSATAASPTRKGSSNSTRPSCTARPTGGGAVAGLRNIMHPAAVARLVMKRTDHCLLVGEGALKFARDARLPRGRPADRRRPQDLAALEGDPQRRQRLDPAPDDELDPVVREVLRASASTARSTARPWTRTATSAA